MNETHSDVIAVIKRFPDRKEVLQKLFLKSGDFQTICEDYRKCKEAWNYWNQPDIENAMMHRNEYAALLLELETEIIQQLDEST